MNLIETIRDAFDRDDLIPRDTGIIIGLSGGADSTALLHTCRELDIPCRAAHLNHQLRGAESDADEQFVRALCNQLEVPLSVGHANVRTLAQQHGESLEMAARRARHDFFRSLAAHPTIALAHHADDQVETFLLRLARGAGSEGLGGMASIREMEGLRFIRPMLSITRAEIRAWLEENDLSWREDASNSDRDFLRNRVRNEVLPMLETSLNPAIREIVLRTMDILRAENEYADAATANISDGTEDHLEAASLLAQPLALRRRIVRQWLFAQGAESAGFEPVERILELAADAQGTSVFELSGRQRVVIEYGRLRMETGEAASAPEWTLSLQSGTGWKTDPAGAPGLFPAEASFCAKRVGDNPITIRTWRAGDRMTPWGMTGSRKLQDIFTDLKVPRSMRTALPVATCCDEIIWLPGYRISRNWAVPSPQARSIHARIEQKRNE